MNYRGGAMGRKHRRSFEGQTVSTKTSPCAIENIICGIKKKNDVSPEQTLSRATHSLLLRCGFTRLAERGEFLAGQLDIDRGDILFQMADP